jgi:hypothetical protein
MFITPIVTKSTPKIKEYTLYEPEPVNLKTYTSSNVQKYGNGPDGWRASTNTAHVEVYGPATQSLTAEVIEEKTSEEK